MIPNSFEAEQAVVGAMLIDNDCISEALGILSSKDFYDKKLSDIYRIIKTNSIKSKNIDLVLISNEIKDNKYKHINLEDVTECIENTPTSANVRYHCDIVKEKSIRRNIIKNSTKLIEEAKTSENIDDVIGGYIDSVNNIVGKSYNGSIETIGSDLNSVLEQIEYNYKNKGGYTGVKSGINRLDNITSGFQKGHLIYLAARPKIGKSSLALNIANYMSMNGKNVAFFSLEMTKAELMKRMLSEVSGVDSHSINRGLLAETHWDKLVDASGKLYNYNLYIDDTPAIKPYNILAKCKQINTINKLDIIFIDYIQLMRPDGKVSSIYEKITEISQRLKQIAKELDVPVVCLSQLSRSLELREDKRPRMSDLRDSGSLEQDADLLLFLYRENYYKDVDRSEFLIYDGKEVNKLWRTAELNIGANRHGATGKIYLDWECELMKFSNLEY